MSAIASVEELPGGYPSPASLLPFTSEEALGIAQRLASKVVKLLVAPTKELFDELFRPDAFWRDQVALTWTLRTFHTAPVISDNLVPLLDRAKIDPASVSLQAQQVLAIPLPNGVSVIRAPFTFRTTNPKAECSIAFKLLRSSEGIVQIFVVATALHALDAAPWGLFDAPQEVSAVLPASVEVLVVGGGHAGLSISAYLKALGVNFAVVEKEPVIGDSWATRYGSTTLHTTRSFSGLPFLPFPDDYPMFVPAKLMAQYYANYVRALCLPAYAGRDCVNAVWDAAQNAWLVTLQRASDTETILARTLVFALGIGGRRPVTPSFSGAETFKGESLHSATYIDASRWVGKHVVIVGASTTACDVALDCVKAGVAEVTMIQRGPTRIYHQSHIIELQKPFWGGGMPIEVGDVLATEDPVYYAGFKRAGFLAGLEGSIQQQIYCRSGSHYPDVGAGVAIASGEIKVKSDASIREIMPTSVVFSDGARLDADVIVYCTGFEKDMRISAAKILGDEVAGILEPVWGLDREGEVRGCWKPSGHDKIWFHGGELQTMRYYGRFLAMQIVAELKGLRPTPWTAH
ncbi:hypothetical protein MKEN_01249700 [Mycena kentingensis (nom. inval.)]|nr:hypothetical protein MKEN_01249700 [Mycena kentingensis (nom. inval.)]